MTIPGCGYRDAVLLDYLHIFHLGYGMDSAASAIVLLAHLGHYGHARSLDARLAVAYDYFDDWCHREGRTSSIDAFSKAQFKMAGKKGFLGRLLAPLFEHGLMGHSRTHLRFPIGTGGKAFDTSLLMAWLQDDMVRGSQAM